MWSGGIAARYLLGARSRLLSGTARSALGSTALGVAAMVISMALMSGYSDSVQSRLLEAGPLIVSPLGDASVDPGAADRIAERLRALPDAGTVAVTVAGQGSLASSGNPAGVDVLTRGVVPGASSFGATEGQLARGDVGIEAIVVGRELQRTLGVSEGDLVRLTAIVASVLPDPDSPTARSASAAPSRPDSPSTTAAIPWSTGTRRLLSGEAGWSSR